MRIISFHTLKNLLTTENKQFTFISCFKDKTLTVQKQLSFQQLTKKEKDNFLTVNNLAITSKNAALWLAKNLKDWTGNIYINSIKSSNFLQHMPNVQITVSKQSYAANLAEKIVTNTKDPVLHLTGNLGLTHLEDELNKNNIECQRLEVYETILTPTQLDLDEIDLLIFSSPSQVVSFFKMNPWKKSIFALCIGKTTAKALENFGVKQHTIFYPKNPGIETMLELLPEINEKLEQQKTR